MRKSVFALDCDPNAYIGYTSGALWNGWATPYFTLEEAQRFQADFNKCTENPMLYDVAKDEFRVKYDGDDAPYIWKGEDVQTVDGKLHLYGIGAYSHIWDELDDDIRRSLAQQINDFLYDYDWYSYEDEYDDRDDVIKEIFTQLANLDAFVKAYEIMNSEAYGENERYAKFKEILTL
jgi:hypothetical protein